MSNIEDKDFLLETEKIISEGNVNLEFLFVIMIHKFYNLAVIITLT